MIPIRDDAPHSTTPFINYFLIVLNLAVYFFQWTLGPQSQRNFDFQFALIPHHVGSWLAGSLPARYALLPFVSSMFLHAGWVHVGFSIWFLAIVGDKAECRQVNFVSRILY